MKKSLFIIICIFALLLGGCANRQNTPLGRGLELLEDMEVLVNSDDMKKLYNFYDDEYESEILKLREVDFSKPEAVYKVTFDDREVLGAVNGENISDEVCEIYESRSAASIASYLNSRADINATVISAVYNVSKVFECKKVDENMVYFYVYDGAVVAVSFIDGEDDACSASASIVSNENLDTSDAQSLDESLESIINCDFEVKKVY
ncbi:MAG: hypothetical protein J6S71_02150 [Clostridia bacterium]|nr:hypothetical protein [Clostridia bacterium]